MNHSEPEGNDKDYLDAKGKYKSWTRCMCLNCRVRRGEVDAEPSSDELIEGAARLLRAHGFKIEPPKPETTDYPGKWVHGKP